MPADTACPDPSRDEVQASLIRILDDPDFKRNTNSSRFLKFIVDETLEGRGRRLKAFTIATLALQRPEDFNPQANSIVRVQAMRLRELLNDYYAEAGAGDPIEIQLPRGVYQPEFVRRPNASKTADCAPAATAIAPETGSTPPPRAEPRLPDAVSSPKSFWRHWPLFALLAAASFALMGLIAVVAYTALSGDRSVGSGAPVVVLLPPEILGAPTTSLLPERFLEEIEPGLSAFDHMVVRRSSSGAETEYDYAIAGRFLETAPGRFEINLRLLRGAAGDVVWSRRYLDVEAENPRAIAELATTTVIAIGDVGGGAVFADLRARLAARHAPLTGFACVMAAYEYVRERREERREATQSCLEAELQNNPDNVSALTTLSTILTINYVNNSPQSRGAADLQRAIQLARRAYDLAPQRAETLTAVFLTRFHDLRFEEAFQVAREAQRANPNSSLLMARISRCYIARERYSEGLALMAPFASSGASPPASMFAPLAIAALMVGDHDKALNYVDRIATASSPLGLVVRIVACHESGETDCVATAENQLRREYPGFAKDVPAALLRHGYTESIRARLLNGLSDAGWAVAGAAAAPSHDFQTKP